MAQAMLLLSSMQRVQEKYERGGWSFHHEQRLEFEEPTDDSSPTITLQFNEESSPDEMWAVDSLGPAKVRYFSLTAENMLYMVPLSTYLFRPDYEG